MWHSSSALCISTWQRASLAGVEQLDSPTLGTSIGPFCSELFTPWDHFGVILHHLKVMDTSPGTDTYW